jgi:cation diffusion facilitator family transporter
VNPEVAANLKRAERLEWLTIGWMASVLAVMTLAMGGSEAFATALIEDWLSLVPAVVFLIAVRLERRGPTRRFPFGFHRVNSLAFLIAAVALFFVGGLLLFESLMTLAKAEHPTIAPVSVFGHQVWAGWVMIAALAYSVVPPFVLGRMKQPVAKALHDKVLHTDALMQRADWMTGLAGIVGILGVGFGYWWADATAASFIAFSVVRDGIRSLRIAAAELIDGAPRAIDSDEIAPDAQAVHDWLAARFPDARIELRETGRYIRAVVVGATPPQDFDKDEADIPGLTDRWRLERVSFSPSAPSRPARSRSAG